MSTVLPFESAPVSHWCSIVHGITILKKILCYSEYDGNKYVQCDVMKQRNSIKRQVGRKRKGGKRGESKSWISVLSFLRRSTTIL